MDPEKERARRPGLARLVAAEAAAYAAKSVLLPVGMLRSGRVRGRGPTVLFVHGYGSGRGAFTLLERSLRRVGYERFAAYGYVTPGQSFRSVVEGLDRFVAREAPAGDLLVVGHSIGGLIARWWLQEHGGLFRTRGLVTLSSPHRGLYLAPLARPLPVVGELSPGSPLLRRLFARAHRLDRIPSLSIISDHDHFVRPASAADFRPARTIRVRDVGHVGVLFAPQVHQLVGGHLVDCSAPPIRAADDDPAPLLRRRGGLS